MLLPEQIEEYSEKGYVKGNIKLSSDQVDWLIEDLELILSGKSEKKPLLMHTAMDDSFRIHQMYNIWMASDLFYQMVSQQDLCEEVAQLYGCDILRLYNDSIQYKPPFVGGAHHWHQDYEAWQFIEPANLLTVWIALDDATVENGCMWMVPGSHKWGYQNKYLDTSPVSEAIHIHKDPSKLPTDSYIKPVPVELKKGEVHYHHCMTWHASPKNTSNKFRRAVAVHYLHESSIYVPKKIRNPAESFFQVNPGEIITGNYFPQVYG